MVSRPVHKLEFSHLPERSWFLFLFHPEAVLSTLPKHLLYSDLYLTSAANSYCIMRAALYISCLVGLFATGLAAPVPTEVQAHDHHKYVCDSEVRLLDLVCS